MRRSPCSRVALRSPSVSVTTLTLLRTASGDSLFHRSSSPYQPPLLKERSASAEFSRATGAQGSSSASADFAPKRALLSSGQSCGQSFLSGSKLVGSRSTSALDGVVYCGVSCTNSTRSRHSSHLLVMPGLGARGGRGGGALGGRGGAGSLYNTGRGVVGGAHHVSSDASLAEPLLCTGGQSSSAGANLPGAPSPPPSPPPPTSQPSASADAAPTPQLLSHDPPPTPPPQAYLGQPDPPSELAAALAVVAGAEGGAGASAEARSLLLAAGVVLTQQLVGPPVLLNYSATLLGGCGAGETVLLLAIALSGGLDLFMAHVSLGLMDRVGRRPLLMRSLFATAGALVVMSLGETAAVLSLHTYISMSISIYLYLSIPIDLSIYLFIYLSIYLSIYTYLSIYLSIPIYTYLSIHI